MAAIGRNKEALMKCYLRFVREIDFYRVRNVRVDVLNECFYDDEIIASQIGEGSYLHTVLRLYGHLLPNREVVKALYDCE